MVKSSPGTMYELYLEQQCSSFRTCTPNGCGGSSTSYGSSNNGGSHGGSNNGGS